MNFGKQIAAVFANPTIGFAIGDEEFWRQLDELYRREYEALRLRQQQLKRDLEEALYLRMRGRLKGVKRIGSGTPMAFKETEDIIKKARENHRAFKNTMEARAIRRAFNKEVTATRRGLWLGRIARAWVTTYKRTCQLTGVAHLLNERCDSDVPIPTVVDGFVRISQLGDTMNSQFEPVCDEVYGGLRLYDDNGYAVGQCDLVPIVAIIADDYGEQPRTAI